MISRKLRSRVGFHVWQDPDHTSDPTLSETPIRKTLSQTIAKGFLHF